MGGASSRVANATSMGACGGRTEATAGDVGAGVDWLDGGPTMSTLPDRGLPVGIRGGIARAAGSGGDAA